MGDAYKCDRCGNYFKGRTTSWRFQLREDALRNSTTPTVRHKRRDLCRDCHKSLTEWFKSDGGDSDDE